MSTITTGSGHASLGSEHTLGVVVEFGCTGLISKSSMPP
jgi:hypothetical protein